MECQLHLWKKMSLRVFYWKEEVWFLPNLQNTYSRLQSQFDDIWWQKWSMAVYVLVSSFLQPTVPTPGAFFSVPFFLKTLSAFMTWDECPQISLGLKCMMIWWRSSLRPCLNSYICRNVRPKEGEGRSLLLYWPVWN